MNITNKITVLSTTMLYSKFTCYIVYLQAIIQIPEKVQSFSITQGNSSKSEEWILLVGSSTGKIYRTNDLECRTQLKQAHLE